MRPPRHPQAVQVSRSLSGVSGGWGEASESPPLKLAAQAKGSEGSQGLTLGRAAREGVSTAARAHSPVEQACLPATPTQSRAWPRAPVLPLQGCSSLVGGAARGGKNLGGAASCPVPPGPLGSAHWRISLSCPPTPSPSCHHRVYPTGQPFLFSFLFYLIEIEKGQVLVHLVDCTC